MIDVLKRLEEIQSQSPEVAKAVDSVTKTNPKEVEENAVQSETNMAKEGCNCSCGKEICESCGKKHESKVSEEVKKVVEYAKTSYKDFLASKGVDIYKLTGDEHSKYAQLYRDFKQGEVAQDTPYSKSGTADQKTYTPSTSKEPAKVEGGMSDIHIGAQEKVGEYIDDADGDLVKPKQQVLADLKAEMNAASFPQSYEIETAIQMVQDGFDDNGIRRDEPDPEDIPHDVDTQMNMDAPAEEPKVEEDMTPIGTREFLNMGAKVEINFDQEQSMMIQGVLNRLDQDALLKAVDTYKAQELDPDQAESKELNTSTMTTEDKKPLKEDIKIAVDSPEEAGVMMQILKLAGVQQVTPDMIGGEPSDGDEPSDDGEQDQADGCPVCGQDGGDMRDIMNKVSSDDEETDEAKADGTWDNTPIEKNQDVDYMQNKLAGGLNKPKQQVRKEYPGDNPLAVEDTVTEQDLANSLRNQYEGFKEQYSKAVEEAKNSK